jgi:hypothetical protein
MTPQEHYTTAEDFLAEAWEEVGYTRANLIAAAQVHATLATITTPPLGRTP